MDTLRKLFGKREPAPVLLSPEHLRYTLRLTETPPQRIELELLTEVVGLEQWSPNQLPYEAGWEEAIACLVCERFAGQDVCLIGYDPPLEWGDLILQEMRVERQLLSVGRTTYDVGFLAQAPAETLTRVAQSEEFRHAALHIAALPLGNRPRLTNFLTALQRSTAHFPPWQKRLHLTPDEVRHLYAIEMEEKLKSNEEFMECDEDGDTVAWYRPAPEKLAQCVTALQAFAIRRGWQVERHPAQELE